MVRPAQADDRAALTTFLTGQVEDPEAVVAAALDGDCWLAEGPEGLLGVLLSGRFSLISRARPRLSTIRAGRIFANAETAPALLEILERQDQSPITRQLTVSADAMSLVELFQARGYRWVQTVAVLRRAGIPPRALPVPPALRLRDADLVQEAEALAALHNAAHGHAFAFSALTAEELRQDAVAPGARYVVLEAPEGPIGAFHTLPNLGFGVLQAVHVSPDRVGQGLGKLLTVAALNALAQAGFGVVQLAVDEQNQAAIGLYLSLGFQRYRQELTLERA